VIVPAVATIASAACLATPVHGGVVKAGPFVGRVAPGYDVVGGRLRLHVGPWRVRRGLIRQPASTMSVRSTTRTVVWTVGAVGATESQTWNFALAAGAVISATAANAETIFMRDLHRPRGKGSQRREERIRIRLRKCRVREPS
jgi:hypothetical protein